MTQGGQSAIENIVYVCFYVIITCTFNTMLKYYILMNKNTLKIFGGFKNILRIYDVGNNENNCTRVTYML